MGATMRFLVTKQLAAELGISHQALSEQLRRAHKVVVIDSVGMNTSVLSADDEDL